MGADKLQNVGNICLPGGSGQAELGQLYLGTGKGNMI